MRDLVHIVIPIYKQFPNETEHVSFEQAMKMLNRYPFKIIAPRDLDLDYYVDIMKKYGVNYSICSFDPCYFVSLEGYNQLMLSKEFYKLFSNSDYVLIHQLDVYVFKDELEYWCNLGYDYVGAPWPPELSEPYSTNIDEWRVGNGGFSLRKVKAILGILNDPFPVKSFTHCWREEWQPRTFWGKILKVWVCLFRTLGYHNTVGYYRKYFPAYEDMFYALCFEGTRLSLKKPDARMASQFSIESGSAILHKGKTELPFGIHAWERHDPEYWKQFM